MKPTAIPSNPCPLPRPQPTGHPPSHQAPTLPPQIFPNRITAGRLLGLRILQSLPPQWPPTLQWLVLGLPRGGVPVGYEVARTLHAPLDVIVVRKLTLPSHPELALGALASTGNPAENPIRILNEDVLSRERIDEDTLKALTQIERLELQRREALFRKNRLPLHLNDKTVIVVDDGVATGATLKAALAAVRLQNPARLLMAVPTIPPETLRQIAPLTDLCVVLQTPDPFISVGQWYRDFSQLQDAEVFQWLERNRIECASPASEATGRP